MRQYFVVDKDCIPVGVELKIFAENTAMPCQPRGRPVSELDLARSPVRLQAPQVSDHETESEFDHLTVRLGDARCEIVDQDGAVWRPFHSAQCALRVDGKELDEIVQHFTDRRGAAEQRPERTENRETLPLREQKPKRFAMALCSSDFQKSRSRGGRYRKIRIARRLEPGLVP